MVTLLAWDVPSIVVVLFFHLAIARQNAKDDQPKKANLLSAPDISDEDYFGVGKPRNLDT